MATYEQFMNAARNADAAGDESAARQLVQAAQRVRVQSAGANLYSFQNRDLFSQNKPQANINLNDVVPGDPTAMTQVMDNVVGLDNGVMSTGEKLATALNNGGESLTLGVVGDEAAAAADALVGRGTYQERLARHRGNQEQFREENPVASFASEMAPALIPGLGIGAMSARGLSAGAGAARAAGTGAAAGALYGFAEGEDGLVNRIANGAASGVAGGAIGAVGPKIAQHVQRVPDSLKRMMGAADQRPTVATLQRVKNQAYKLVDESGEVFSPEEMTGLSQRVRAAFDANNYVEETDSASRAVLSILDKRQSQPTTISQLDNIRQNLWKRYGSAKDQPQILDAIGAIDDLIDSRAGTSELMGAARAANAKYAKARLLERELMKDADQAASAGSGGNIANKMRQTFTAIVNDERKAKFFTADEIAKMREAIHPTRGEAIMRKVGKLSPDGNGLMLALHTIGGVTTGGATLPLMAAGGMAKAGADKGVERKAQQVMDMVTGFAPERPVGPIPLGAGVTSAPLAEETASGILQLFPSQ